MDAFYFLFQWTMFIGFQLGPDLTLRVQLLVQSSVLLKHTIKCYGNSQSETEVLIVGTETNKMKL